MKIGDTFDCTECGVPCTAVMSALPGIGIVGRHDHNQSQAHKPRDIGTGGPHDDPPH